MRSIRSNSEPARWLSLKKAADWAGMGQKRMAALVNATPPVIRGFKDPDSGRGDYIIDRYSIDEYRINQYNVAAAAKNIEAGTLSEKAIKRAASQILDTI